MVHNDSMKFTSLYSEVYSHESAYDQEWEMMRNTKMQYWKNPVIHAELILAIDGKIFL